MAATSGSSSSTNDAIPNCTACENSKNRAVARCTDCKDYLCETCLDSHKRLRVLKKHRVVQITLCSSCEWAGRKCMAVVRCADCNDTLCNTCLEAHRRLRALKDHEISNVDLHTQQKQQVIHDHNHNQEVPNRKESHQQHQQQQQQQPKNAVIVRRSSSKASTKPSEQQQQAQQQQQPKTTGIIRRTSSKSSRPVNGKVRSPSSGSSSSTGSITKSLRKVEEYGREGEVRVLAGRGLAMHPNGSSVVVDCQGLKVFSSSGRIRFYFNMQQGFPDVKSQLSDVAVTREGLIIVVDETPHIKVFNPDGRFVRQFVALTPDGKSSASIEIHSRLVSTFVDHMGKILVGSGSKPYYISIHKAAEDGNHVASLKTDIEPRCMAVSPKDNTIIVGCWSDASVHILNRSGEFLRTIMEPKHLKWLPVSVCFTQENEILISNVGSPGIGVYRFDEQGKLIGCATEDVKYPWGIALKNHSEVIVADTESIKVFQWQ